jgi:hypothetical protein
MPPAVLPLVPPLHPAPRAAAPTHAHPDPRARARRRVGSRPGALARTRGCVRVHWRERFPRALGPRARVCGRERVGTRRGAARVLRVRVVHAQRRAGRAAA